MRAFLISAAAAATLTLGFSTTEAEARFFDPGINAPGLVESAACTVRRVRTVRPNGRVVVRTVRNCGPGMRPRDRCRVVRERIKRPNGNVVVRTVRRCR